MSVAVHERWGLTKNTVEWATPRVLYEKLDAEFRFTMDPCPMDAVADGRARLFNSWRGHRVFCNPPYGPGLKDWLLAGMDADVAVFLLPVRTDTKWFCDYVMPFASEIRFIKGRLRFSNNDNVAPFPSMVVIFKGEHRVNSETECRCRIQG
jgi:hypothetical protein